MHHKKVIAKKKLISELKEQKIWQKLILQNCLPIGKQAKFTSKNVTQYLLGSRNGIDFFKFNEIKHILLKITPLIETLFYNNIILANKFGHISKKVSVPPKQPRDKSPANLAKWRLRVVNWHKTGWINSYWTETLENKKPIKVLFASTTPEYSNIISDAAALCHMSVKTKRWLCGYISANTINLEEFDEKSQTDFSDEHFAHDSQTDIFTKLGFNHKNIIKEFETTYSKNKELKYKRYDWHLLQKNTHRPSLAIIPDIHNNDMILREIQPKNIPIIGLVNSNCSIKITYPVFGNADSLRIVHFFCHFLAVLIAKSYMQQEYKEKSHRIFFRTRIRESQIGISDFKRNIIKGFRGAMRVNSKKFLQISNKLNLKKFVWAKKTFKNRINSRKACWKQNSSILWRLFKAGTIIKSPIKNQYSKLAYLKKNKKLQNNKFLKRLTKNYLNNLNKIKNPLANKLFGFLFALKKIKKWKVYKRKRFASLNYFPQEFNMRLHGTILRKAQLRHNASKKNLNNFHKNFRAAFIKEVLIYNKCYNKKKQRRLKKFEGVLEWYKKLKNLVPWQNNKIKLLRILRKIRKIEKKLKIRFLFRIPPTLRTNGFKINKNMTYYLSQKQNNFFKIINGWLPITKRKPKKTPRIFSKNFKKSVKLLKGLKKSVNRSKKSLFKFSKLLRKYKKKLFISKQVIQKKSKNFKKNKLKKIKKIRVKFVQLVKQRKILYKEWKKSKNLLNKLGQKQCTIKNNKLLLDKTIHWTKLLKKHIVEKNKYINLLRVLIKKNNIQKRNKNYINFSKIWRKKKNKHKKKIYKFRKAHRIIKKKLIKKQKTKVKTMKKLLIKKKKLSILKNLKKFSIKFKIKKNKKNFNIRLRKNKYRKYKFLLYRQSVSYKNLNRFKFNLLKYKNKNKPRLFQYKSVSQSRLKILRKNLYAVRQFRTHFKMFWLYQKLKFKYSSWRHTRKDRKFFLHTWCSGQLSFSRVIDFLLYNKLKNSNVTNQIMKKIPHILISRTFLKSAIRKRFIYSKEQKKKKFKNRVWLLRKNNLKSNKIRFSVLSNFRKKVKVPKQKKPLWFWFMRKKFKHLRQIFQTPKKRNSLKPGISFVDNDESYHNKPAVVISHKKVVRRALKIWNTSNLFTNKFLDTQAFVWKPNIWKSRIKKKETWKKNNNNKNNWKILKKYKKYKIKNLKKNTNKHIKNIKNKNIKNNKKIKSRNYKSKPKRISKKYRHPFRIDWRYATQKEFSGYLPKWPEGLISYPSSQLNPWKYRADLMYLQKNYSYGVLRHSWPWNIRKYLCIGNNNYIIRKNLDNARYELEEDTLPENNWVWFPKGLPSIPQSSFYLAMFKQKKTVKNILLSFRTKYNFWKKFFQGWTRYNYREDRKENPKKRRKYLGYIGLSSPIFILYRKTVAEVEDLKWNQRQSQIHRNYNNYSKKNQPIYGNKNYKNYNYNSNKINQNNYRNYNNYKNYNKNLKNQNNYKNFKNQNNYKNFKKNFKKKWIKHPEVYMNYKEQIAQIIKASSQNKKNNKSKFHKNNKYSVELNDKSYTKHKNKYETHMQKKTENHLLNRKIKNSWKTNKKT